MPFKLLLIQYKSMLVATNKAGLNVQATLKKKLFFDNDYVTIGYNVSMDALVISYKRYGKEEEFVDVNKKLIDVYQDIKSGKCIADIRKMGVISVRAQQLIGEVIIPSLVEISPDNTLYHAQIITQDIFVKVAAMKVKATSEAQSLRKGKVVVQQFIKEEDANNWLLNCR